MNIEKIISEMTFEEKAKFITGTNSMDTYAIERLGIPAITMADGPHGVRLSPEKNCTHFPNLCTVANTWSRETTFLLGSAIADDCKKHGVHLILGPGINLKRHILNGRNFEYFSEDPYLTGELTASYVNGVQDKGVGTCVKHYAVNNQEMHRLYESAEVDERTLREMYIRGFEIAVEKSNPSSIMCAYNKVNGVWCSENVNLLREILKDDIGFEGVVISDWGAVQNAARAFGAGLDLQMPCNPNIVEELKKGIEDGRLTMADIDEAVRRMLKLVQKHMNLPECSTYDRDRQHEIAKQIAADGTVLLKNENGVLPITKDKYKSIAVIGDYATEPLIAGQGSAEVNQSAEYTDSPLEELKKRLPETEFKYIECYSKSRFSTEMLWPKCGQFASDIAECDLCIFFAGSMLSEDTENLDRRSAAINENVEIFVRTAIQCGKKVIVVLQNGGALVLGKWIKASDAIVDMYLAGEAAGSAIADVLCGIVNPSGKLSETFPTKVRSDLEYPGNEMYIEYKERFDVGYRYYDKHPDEILYPFGHGLSYTAFEYSNLEIDSEKLIIKCDIKNVGEFDGAEVVQLYIGDRTSTVVRPIKELKGFEKVFLKAGEVKTIEFKLSEKDLSYFSAVYHKWVLENGIYDIYIGASSRDIRLMKSIDVQKDMLYSMQQTRDAMIG